MENHRFLSSRHMNTIGTLFGGQILSWFDEEAALFAYECLGEQEPKRMTGVCVYSFNFLKPAYIKDRIRSRWEIVHIGKTSLTVKGIYEAWQLDANDFQQKWTKVAQGYSCLCSITQEGKPTAFNLKPEIDVEEIKLKKEWDVIENLKALTRLNQ